MTMDHEEFGTSDAYNRAFQAILSEGIPENHLALLRAHFQAPGHTVTWAQLAKRVGYANRSAVNLQYGTLARRVAKQLRIDEAPKGFWLFVLVGWAGKRDAASGHTAFILRRPVIRALTQLRILSDDTGVDHPSPKKGTAVTRFWMCHWQNCTWRDDVNTEYRPIRGSLGNSFQKRNVSAGDVAYVISLAEGHLLLGGRMTVSRIVSRNEAVRIFGDDNLYPAEESKALCFASATRLNAQTTRRLRELTPESAALLERIIVVTDELPRSRQLITVTEEMLHLTWARICRERGRLPEEIPSRSKHVEGSVQRILVNRYERDPRDRRECIQSRGTVCEICGFDFVAKYGNVMDGFIHVHHQKQLSTVGEDYEVDAIRDLVPVCPNCHAVLHYREPPYSVDEVRQFLRDQRKRE
jgi:hypothetical protein